MKNLLIFVLLLVFIPAQAFSHSGMKNCSPLKDEIVKTVPEKVVIEFEGAFEPAFSKIEVFDQEKQKVSKKTKFTGDNTILESGLNENLASGKYKVKWKIMSIDGHKMSGKYSFTIE